MRPIIAWLFLVSVCFGQIKMVEQKTETWAGLKAAVVNNDGTVTTGPDSKPLLVSKSVKYSFETAVQYKFSQLKVKRSGTGEKVSLDKDPSSETYSFRPGATAGKYEFSYTVFDPEKGIDSDEWEVDYQPVVAPKPDDPKPNPTPVPPKPTPDVVNDYNLGKLVLANAPSDPELATKIAGLYRFGSGRLYGTPTIATIDTILAEINAKFASRQCKDQATCELWAKWKSVLDNALRAEQVRRKTFTREDWYAALNEIATALEAVR